MKPNYSPPTASSQRHSFREKSLCYALLFTALLGNFHLQAQGSCKSRGFVTVGTFPSGGMTPFSFVLADFNKDGKNDLAVVNIPNFGDDGNVGVLLNKGNSRFAEAVTYPSGGQTPVSITAGDFNGDGIADLAVANSVQFPAENGTIGLLMGTGDGRFAPLISFQSKGNPKSLTTGDFNEDGKPDLAVATVAPSGNGNIEIRLGNGRSGFKEPLIYMSGGYFPTAIATGDFNKDGVEDLVFTNEYNFLFDGSNVGVLLGKGNGNFAAVVTYSSGGFGASDITVGDFDNDGTTDLAIPNSQSLFNIGILRGNGDGSFTEADITQGGGEYTRSIVAGDFNDDGRLDFAVANHNTSSSGTVVVLQGDGKGNFAPTFSFESGSEFTPSDIETDDFNKDGKPDLIVAGNDFSEGRIDLLQSAIVNTSFAPVLMYQSCGSRSEKIVSADFNNDGRQDLAVKNFDIFSGHVICLLPGNGKGGFSSGKRIVSSSIYSSLTTGDFNKDGNADLAITNEGSIGVLLGMGTGSFTAILYYPGGSDFPRSLITGDFNNDGNPDLAVGNLDGSVSVLHGNGSGSFAPAAIYQSGGSHCEDIISGDFNKDGKLDIAVAHGFGNNTLGVLFGKNDGGFSPAVTFESGGKEAFALGTGDFNKDGNPDLAIVNFGENIGVLLGDGNGGFAPAVTYASGGQVPNSLAIGDFNRDGNLDLAVVHSDPSFVGVLLGDGNGGFAPAVTYASGGDEPGAVIAGDFNANGSPDLAIANKTGGIGVLLNTCGAAVPSLSSFTLVNASANQNIKELREGDVIDLATLPPNTKLNIRANTSPAVVGSVVFELQGPQVHQQTENLLPYALFGDNTTGSYYGVFLQPGDYTLTATPYSEAKGAGKKGMPLTIHFKVIYPAAVSGYTLVNADTDIDIMPLKEDNVIDLATLPPGTRLNIRANTSPTQVGSVVFNLSGAQTRLHTEYNAPYALFVNDKQDYFPWVPQVGNYTLTATPRSNTGGGGAEGSPLTIRFSIIYSATVSSFTLVNATTNKDVRELKEGEVIDLASMGGAKLNIRANTSPATVGSVVFNLSGAQVHPQVENLLPYALFGDDMRGKYYGSSLQPGDYTLTAIPYNAGRVSNAKGTPLVIHFKVVSKTQEPCTTPSFGPVVNYQSDGREPRSLAPADFNGDGKLDLAVRNSTIRNTTLRLLLGKGDGTFAPPNIYSIGGGHLVSGDFNGDGKPDLALVTSNATIGVSLNTCGSPVPSALAQIKAEALSVPAATEQKQARLSAAPNPFSSQTIIRFSFAQAGFATLSVYNIGGVEVARLYQGQMEAGQEYRRTFDSKGLPAGVYMIRLATGKEVATSKVVLLR